LHDPTGAGTSVFFPVLPVACDVVAVHVVLLRRRYNYLYYCGGRASYRLGESISGRLLGKMPHDLLSGRRRDLTGCSPLELAQHAIPKLC